MGKDVSGHITGLDARMILDSRGNPTVEVDCYVDGALAGRAAVPSGASTGRHEAVELRDGGQPWLGKGVDAAVTAVTEHIAQALVGMPVDDQRMLDETIVELDGTGNKSRLGANATLGASLACLHAGAAQHELPVWRYVGGVAGGLMPVPMMNILNGGAHAASNVDVQEFMVVPHGFDSFGEGLRAGVETYHALKAELRQDGLLGGIGDEGGFAPNLPSNEDGLRYLVRAIEAAGYSTEQMGIALDVASTEFHRDGAYHIDGQAIDSEGLADLYSGWLDEYPILSIEDGFDEDDWLGWSRFTAREGHRVQIVGDDLFVTQSERLARGIEMQAANAMLVKVNQVGTVTETLEAMDLASRNGFNNVVSHRSGETEDVTIADLCVGTRAGQIKTGAPARSDRTAKYNQLLRIASEVSDYASPFDV
ncbi:MAG: phosphopyruvate hydratase [Candidatus Thermoplasmatota archaeon]|nr:phosphopyruvate hydratase [Candidatus Thermoplasmatota archaeon]MEC7151052.1 phosphopyruvate hydratase [Candidatus Thermoplasmatota archaeon]MEC7279557.1 phosphopyruvate hydratase [Candidatus Thermoplasmatota archaeon]MEC7460742.1 phosphopyruvate hydratase [Candidatus Thermoplasmatota archaeon]MEC8079459.1 phosphopyruvate hydratase [Candidatus Thermoplasmatota archaeon]